jgi:hypothetical protein
MDPPLAISVRLSISLIGLGLGERDGAAESDGKKEGLKKPGDCWFR